MKTEKNYQAPVFSITVFESNDVVRTSVGTVDTFTETDVSYETYFGEVNQ